jgi:hypothetical protein
MYKLGQKEPQVSQFPRIFGHAGINVFVIAAVIPASVASVASIVRRRIGNFV